MRSISFLLLIGCAGSDLELAGAQIGAEIDLVSELTGEDADAPTAVEALVDAGEPRSAEPIGPEERSVAPGGRRTERFRGGGFAADLIVVVDNSGSMGEEHARLAPALISLVDSAAAEGVDLRVGLITTDMDDPAERGRLHRVNNVPWTTADPGEDYAGWLTIASAVGTTGSPEERPLQAAVFGIMEPISNGFGDDIVRPAADLHLLFVTDEDDSGLFAVGDWIRGFNRQKPGQPVARAHALSGPATVGCATASPAPRLRAVAGETAGRVGDICDADWTPLIDRIAADLVTRDEAGQTFPLAQAADPATIVVVTEGPTGGIVVRDRAEWAYDAFTGEITLTSEDLPPGTGVEVSYTVAP
jgi:hypothetical protein